MNDKMRIDILTVMPEMLESPLNCSILKRAQDKGLVEIVVHNLRDYSLNKHRKVDDYPFGGEAGMVMQIEPVDRCISALKSERNYDDIIFTTPDGEQFSQPIANELSMAHNLMIFAATTKAWTIAFASTSSHAKSPLAIMCSPEAKFLPP